MKVSKSSTRIWAFFFLTFAWSWTCWLLSPAVKPQLPSLATMLMFAGRFGPCVAAVLVVANAGGRAGLRAWFGRCLQWRIGWGWMALALLLPAAPTTSRCCLAQPSSPPLPMRGRRRSLPNTSALRELRERPGARCGVHGHRLCQVRH